MVKRKTSLTRVSTEALEKIEQLKKDSGMTSAQIIDDALKNYLDISNKSSERSNRLSKAFQAMFNKASSNKGKLDKDDPTILNAAKVAKELGITPDDLEKRGNFQLEDVSIKFESPQEFTEFFDKLRREHRKAFMKEMQSNPKFTTLDNTKPPNAVIDSAILSCWDADYIAMIVASHTEVLNNRTRSDIMTIVASHMDRLINGISWSEFHKTWFKSYGKYKGKFEQTVDNRIYALIRNKIIKPFGGTDLESNKYEGNIHKVIDNKFKNVKKGVYTLTRELSEDEWKVIKGVLSIQSQRGILIPKII